MSQKHSTKSKTQTHRRLISEDPLYLARVVDVVYNRHLKVMHSIPPIEPTVRDLVHLQNGLAHHSGEGDDLSKASNFCDELCSNKPATREFFN